MEYGKQIDILNLYRGAASKKPGSPALRNAHLPIPNQIRRHTPWISNLMLDYYSHI